MIIINKPQNISGCRSTEWHDKSGWNLTRMTCYLGHIQNNESLTLKIRL